MRCVDHHKKAHSLPAEVPPSEILSMHIPLETRAETVHHPFDDFVRRAHYQNVVLHIYIAKKA